MAIRLTILIYAHHQFWLPPPRDFRPKPLAADGGLLATVAGQGGRATDRIVPAREFLRLPSLSAVKRAGWAPSRPALFHGNASLWYLLATKFPDVVPASRALG